MVGQLNSRLRGNDAGLTTYSIVSPLTRLASRGAAFQGLRSASRLAIHISPLTRPSVDCQLARAARKNGTKTRLDFLRCMCTNVPYIAAACARAGFYRAATVNTQRRHK